MERLPRCFLPRSVAIDIVHTISSLKDFGTASAYIQLMSCDSQISADSLAVGWHIDLESDELREVSFALQPSIAMLFSHTIEFLVDTVD